MGDILVYAEQHDGTFTPGSLGLLGEARRLADALGVQAHAVVCGSGLDDAACAILGRHGATRVVLCDDEALASGLPQPAVDAVAGVVGEGGHSLVLFGASVLASDVAAGLSARLDAGIVVDAVELHDEDGRVVTRRPGLGDSVLGHCAVPGAIAVIVARANAFAPSEEHDAWTAEVARASVSVQDWSRAAQVVGHEEAETGGVDITAADTLVAGGRGLGSAEGFRLLEALAQALGGEVAATRAVVDSGWYPYAAQVGQTGKTVSPKLYIACGISGAIQHKVGMTGSGTIVAINKDANAPIFDFADLGVVGDLNAVLPKLTALLQARRS
ncbi:MAG: electron transfer flavoprotein alpha subunit [Gaiellales bacterium]|jgi:electron transfer flavoprotein alpha subunit|nr:electron transfer flavoprotein alpha subunit [Gaiellales bacterium]